MIMVIVGAWLGLLWLLIKVGVFKGWTLWMKLSPIAVWAIATLTIFLPLNWVAPTGPVTIISRSIGITPSVAGVVTEVLIKSWVPLKKGDVLFKIDREPFEAAVEQIKARLDLVQLRLQQKSELVEKGAGRAADVQSLKAEVKQLQAQLKAARWDLDKTTVRAPFDGMVPNVVLEPGTRVSTAKATLPLIDNVTPIVMTQIAQNYLRYIKAGDQSEVIFSLYPGKTFAAMVVKVYLAHPSGQLEPSGQVPTIKETGSERFGVWLKLKDQNVILPTGAAGTAAIYTSQSAGTAVLRQIMLRMTTWLNYL